MNKKKTRRAAIILIGPQGCGKSVLMRRILKMIAEEFTVDGNEADRAIAETLWLPQEIHADDVAVKLQLHSTYGKFGGHQPTAGMASELKPNLPPRNP